MGFLVAFDFSERFLMAANRVFYVFLVNLTDLTSCYS